MISVNKRAAAIVQQMLDDCEALGLRSRCLKNGSTVLDAGIDVPAALRPGRLFACVSMGGLGQVAFTQQYYGTGEDGFRLPAVAVTASLPHIACMASQYAGWAIKQGGYSPSDRARRARFTPARISIRSWDIGTGPRWRY